MRTKLTTLLLMLFCVVLAMPASPINNGKEETLSALAQLPVAGTTMNVRIYLKSYSTPQEAQQLHSVLMDGGPSALLKTLKKMKPIGRIEQEGTLGFYDFKLILSKSQKGERKRRGVAHLRGSNQGRRRRESGYRKPCICSDSPTRCPATVKRPRAVSVANRCDGDSYLET